jgi:hypothetical protein
MAKVHVFCSRPGMHRGGRPNPRHAEYDPGEHTPAQLRELVEDPETTVVIGDLVTEDYIAEAEKLASKKGAR